MAYSPPDRTKLYFAVAPGTYVAPGKTELDFTPGVEGGDDIFVNVLDYPFAITNVLSTEMVPEVQVPLLGLSGTGALTAELFWFYPLSALSSGVSEIAIPYINISLFLSPLEGSSAITSVLQERVRLDAFNSASQLDVQAISMFEEGYTVVSPWPGILTSTLKIPDTLVMLSIPAFTLTNSFENPYIIAGTTAFVSAQPFESTSLLHVDLCPIVFAGPFTLTDSLTLEFIKVMPEGDQYLGMPPLVLSYSLQVPVIQSGIMIPAFESISEIVIDEVYVGIRIPAEPFEFTSSLSAQVLTSISAPPMQISQSLAATVLMDIWASPLESTSALECSIYDGAFVICPPFTQTNVLNAVMGFSIDLVTFPMQSSGSLRIPAVSSFISAPSLILTSTLDLDGIIIFTLESAQTFYYFTLTGSGDSTTDIEIPISSFQCRKRNGDPSYLQVVIPGIAHAGEISDRSNGDLEVYIGYKIDGEIVTKKLIVSANLETIRIDKGTDSQSITLSGHKTETFTPKSISLSGATYQSITDGKLRYRVVEPDVNLNAGDSVTIDGMTFSADLISYYVSATKDGLNQNMEISQEA